MEEGVGLIDDGGVGVDKLGSVDDIVVEAHLAAVAADEDAETDEEGA